jgi:hypothetical protein
MTRDELAHVFVLAKSLCCKLSRHAAEIGTDLIVLQSTMGKGRVLRKIASGAGRPVLAV